MKSWQETAWCAGMDILMTEARLLRVSELLPELFLFFSLSTSMWICIHVNSTAFSHHHLPEVFVHVSIYGFIRISYKW